MALYKPCNCYLVVGGLGLNCTEVNKACQEAQDMIHAFSGDGRQVVVENNLSLIHISEPTRLDVI
eukprot:3183529-Prorocentrum_lima.AAC.1